MWTRRYRVVCSFFGLNVSIPDGIRQLLAIWRERGLKTVAIPVGGGLNPPDAHLRLAAAGRCQSHPATQGWLEPNSFRVPEVEPELAAALSELTDRQRTAVVLVSGYGWTLREVGELDDISPSTVAAHLRRGLEQLRNHLGVDHEPLV